MKVNLSAMKRLLFCLVIIMTFSSCKKDDDTQVAESFISCEVNGVPVEIKSKTDITFSFLGAIQTVGSETPTNILHLKAPDLLIKVRDFTMLTPITTAVYSGKTYDNDGNVKGVEISHTQNNIYYESSFTNPETEVRIVSISREGVTGTFKGKVINNLDTLEIEKGLFAIYNYKN